MRTKALLVLALASAAVPAMAQVSFYAGASGGQAQTRAELVANRESTILFARNVRTDFDDKDTAWKAFGGVRLNSVVGIEASYVDLGKHSMRTTLLGGDPPLPAAVTINRKVTGYGVDLVGTAPLGFQRFSVFGKVGAFRSRLEADASLEGNIEFSGGSGERSRSTSRRETSFHYGIGADIGLARNLAVRIELERFEDLGKAFVVGGEGTTGEADTDVLSVGVVFRF